jgi:hypothetical protein
LITDSNNYCFTLHRCTACTALTCCEITKDMCPWFLLDRDDIDGMMAGALCLPCMNIVMEGMQIWADSFGDEDDPA